MNEVTCKCTQPKLTSVLIKHCFNKPVIYKRTHPYHLLRQWMCTQWTPRRRCWTGRLPLHQNKKGQRSAGYWRTRKLRTSLFFSPRGTPDTAAIPLISSRKGFGRVSAIIGCRTRNKSNQRESLLWLNMCQLFQEKQLSERRCHAPASGQLALSASRWARKH